MSVKSFLNPTIPPLLRRDLSGSRAGEGIPSLGFRGLVGNRAAMQTTVESELVDHRDGPGCTEWDHRGRMSTDLLPSYVYTHDE